jgi:hypothetical protein
MPCEPGVFRRHELLQLRPHQSMIPIEQAEERLQRAGRNPLCVGDRFAVLTRQIGQLTLGMHRQVPTRVTPPKAVRKSCEIRPQIGHERANLIGIRAWFSGGMVPQFRRTQEIHQQQ